MGKTVGVIIPDNVKQIYVFDNEKDFKYQIDNGSMKPLYGNKEYETSFMKLYIAYKSEIDG